MSNFLTITQTSQIGIINNIHTADGGGLNIQDNSSSILIISPLGDVSCNSLLMLHVMNYIQLLCI